LPNSSELNQYRRLVGDIGINAISADDIVIGLNDATWELTSHNYSTPIGAFDAMPVIYHNEIVWKAAINYWWNQVAYLQAKLSTTVGSASQNVSDKWTRALQMVTALEARYDEIQELGETILEGNFSRFSKQTLRRIGGVEEEQTPIPAPFSGISNFWEVS
jgi:predicted phosphohydrolase